MSSKQAIIRRIYYLAVLFSLLIVAVALLLPAQFDISLEHLWPWNKMGFSLVDALLSFAFSLWAWLLIIGLFLVPKSSLLWGTCILLSLPQGVFIVVSLAFGDDLVTVLKSYLLILSFFTT